MEKEQAVRDAAVALKEAIVAAVAAGYRVEWPGSPDHLDKIAISETGKVKPPVETVVREPAQTFGRPRGASDIG